MPGSYYRKIFENLEEYSPEPEDLRELATVMSGKVEFPDAAQDSGDQNAGVLENIATATMEALGLAKAAPLTIPAGYTYFSQFLVHDISLDSRSDRFLEADRPWNEIDITKVENKRTPFFDLETIYGHEHPINKDEISRDKLLQDGELPFLRLGDTERADGFPSFPNDLPRKEGSADADIVESRNDENLLVAQTQVAFIKFHNAIVLELNATGKYKNREELFDNARRLTIRYYQHIILEDFLLRFIEKSFRDEIIEKVKSGEGLFYNATSNDMFLPVEFSVAVFRMGHSMIRAEYDLNVVHNTKTQSAATLDKMMLFTGRGKMLSSSLAHHLKLPSSWIINWYLFFEIDNSTPNIAERIDTDIPLALLRLRPKIEINSDPTGMASSIAALDLFRGRAFKLPSGQDIAKAINANIISQQEIEKLLESKKIKFPNLREEVLGKLKTAFGKKSPLWFYILAEAEIQNDGKFGAVGSRIFAESIIKILYFSEFSILQEEWKPEEDFLLKTYGNFGMAEMLKFVRDRNKKYFKVLYPGRNEYFDELNPLEKVNEPNSLEKVH